MRDPYEKIIICPYYNQCQDEMYEETTVYYDNNPTSPFKVMPKKRCLQFEHDGRDKINKTLKRTKKHVCSIVLDRNKYPSLKNVRDTLLAERKESLKKYYLIDYIRVLNIIEQKMKEEN